MSGTLAYNMRPQSLLDILGQKHIIGENGLFTKFVEKNQYEILFATDTRFEIISVSEQEDKINIKLKEL